jgi:hypothetical protein
VIAVVLNDEPDNDEVVQYAMEEDGAGTLLCGRSIGD